MNISRSKRWTAERGEEGRRNRSFISSQSAALYTGLHVFNYAEARQNLAFLCLTETPLCSNKLVVIVNEFSDYPFLEAKDRAGMTNSN